MRTISGRLSEIARRAVIEEAEASPSSKGGGLMQIFPPAKAKT
jgi:hypothetical protein